MTSAQEEFALRSCYPLYAEWCREDEDDGEPDLEPDMDWEVDLEPDMDWEMDLGDEVDMEEEE